MAGNSFGEVFRITTFGESHGKGIGVVVDGCPPGISLKQEDFEYAMARRRPGGSDFDTPRREDDNVEILSGVFEDLTTGTPIALFIKNKDARSKSYDHIKNLFRPGHGDFTYYNKYGHFDYRGAGRYSARETAARVAAGAIADKITSAAGINVTAYTIEIGGIRAEVKDFAVIESNPLCCPDMKKYEEMAEALAEAKANGDSLGGVVEVVVKGCPPGLGEPVFDKLSADLARAVMSIGAIKGFEIGAGFEAARLKGSENNDPITPEGFSSNNAGGILAGISNGDDIILRAAVKPIPSIGIEQDTIDKDGNSTNIKTAGRFDVTAIPRVLPVLEAMVKIVLADHYLRNSMMSMFRHMPGEENGK
ncbi:MAG: chorismate synthase [Desulfobacteraceae bacterium]